MPNEEVARFDPGEPVGETSLDSQLFSQCLDLLNDHGGLLVQRHDTFPFCLTCRQMKPGSSIGRAIQALQRQPSTLLTPGSAPAGG